MLMLILLGVNCLVLLGFYKLAMKMTPNPVEDDDKQ
jgi:hypothetical protein